MERRRQRQYINMLRKANKVVRVDRLEDYRVKGLEVGEYHPAKLQKRNEFLVDNCNILIALWSGKKSGGTYNCIRYAEKKGAEIIYLNFSK